MEYRNLGRSGLKVSELSFGSWVTIGTQADLVITENMLGICRDGGINFIDGAEGYNRGEAERLLGAAFKKLDWSRDSVILSSKVFFGGVDNPTPTQIGLSRKHIVEACHQALKRWQVDYLDLYFCHRPDPQTPIAETVRTMTELIQQGKVLYWGTSEWSAQEITEAWGIAARDGLIAPTMEQPQYNLLARERFEKEYQRLYNGEVGLGTTIWSPLHSGMLTGKYLDGSVPQGSRASLPQYGWLRKRMIDSSRGQDLIEKTRKIKSISDELNVSLANLSLAWCLKNPNVSTVILGASNSNQLEQNLSCTKVLPLLTDEIMNQLNEITK